MRNILTIILFTFLSFITSTISGKNSDSRFMRLAENEDKAPNEINIYPILNKEQLPSNSVKYIYQDNDGFLWIATDNGLCFYDGYNTRIFRYDSDGNILRNNKISQITGDRKGRIWVSSVNGCFVVDKNNGYKVFIPEALNLSRHVTCITVMENGEVLAALRDKIIHLDSELNEISSVTVVRRSDEYINQITESRDGRVFLLLNRSGILLYDTKTGKTEKYPNDLKNTRYGRMIQDPETSCFWITTTDKGILRFNPDSDDKFTLQPETLGSNETESSYIFINIDTINGDLWSISQAKLCRFERTAEGTLKNKPIINSVLDGKLWEDITTMNNGNLIIASRNDNSYIIDFRNTSSKIYTLDNLLSKIGLSPAISTLAKLKNDKYLLMQERFGLMLYDKRNGSLITKTKYGPEVDASDADIVQLWSFNDNEDIIWGAHRTKPLLYLIRLKDNEIYVEKTIKFGTRWRRCYIVEGENGILFVNNGKELYRYDTRSESVSFMQSNVIVARNMKIDDNGILWVNDPTYGVHKVSDIYGDDYNIDFFEFTEYVVMDLEAMGDDIYFCTEDGRFFHKAKDEKPVDITDNIIWDGNKFYNIIKDEDSHLWIFSDQRVIEYFPNEKYSREYSTLDYNIPITRFIPGAISGGHKNEILYGGYGGFISFNNDKGKTKDNNRFFNFADLTNITPLFVTDVTNGGKSLMFSGDPMICGSSEVVLSPDQSEIIISVSNLDMLNGRQAKYAYKLEGEADWKYLTKGDNKIFLHLNKGEHKLLVKHRASNGKWNSNTLEYLITRKPAYYETTLAYSVYIFLLLLSVVLFTLFYKRILEKRNSKKLEADLVKIKLDYFSNISHDLLTPLTIISCAAEDIVSEAESDKDNVGIIRSNIIRLKQLFQEILDYRKIESGKMQLNIKYGQLDSFIYNIIDCFRGVISKNSITLTVELKENMTAYFDPDKLEKILFNLLSNAVKYTDYGASISIFLYDEETESGTYAVIEVHDTGVGIDEKEQDKIFSPFYNNPDAKPGTSNGIGLSLCKQIALLHKGDITLSSRKGEGSVFSVRIPVGAAAYGLISGPENIEKIDIAEVPKVATEKTSRKNLLIVEDDIDLQNMIRKIFIKDYTVFIANNGLEALSIVASKEINIIISDISMPGMDGITLCKRIKEDINTSHIPVLLLTAGVNSQTRIDGYKAGADAYLEKPFENNLLIARIDNLINKYDRAAENFKSSNDVNIREFEVCSIDEEFLNKVISSIQTHISDSDFDINRLSSELCMSRSTLSRKLKTITGQTPIDFVHNIKMKNACRLLKETDKSITEIAYELGIDDSRYFSRRFKETFKMTPTQYRDADN